LNKTLIPVLAAVLALSGCRKAVIEKMAPPDVQQASLRAVSDLRAGRFADVSQSLLDEIRRRDHTADLRKMAASFPDEEARSVSPVGYYFFTGTGGGRYDIVYEYEFTHLWVVAQFSWVRVNGQLRMSNFSITPSPESQDQQNAIHLGGKRPISYVILLLGSLVVALSLAALVKCILTPNLEWKFPWIVFIGLGFGTFSVNWNSGASHFDPLHFQLLSFSAMSRVGESWTFSVSFPVGAVVFLDFLRKRRRAQEAAAQEPPTAS
jgi:hypothetical protein